MKNNFFLIGGMLAFMLSFFTIQNNANAQLYINEFMASNDFSFPGPQGDYPDWIEIYNSGTEDVMLGGYYMYDTLDATIAYQVPGTYPDSVTVEAGGFILFYANNGNESSVLNLGFKLSGGGEQVGLWDPSQNLLDGKTYGEQIADTSYGRYPDGSDTWLLMPNYTPGAPNQDPSAINEIGDNASISQNFPNPFSTETNIQFTLENSDQVKIEVFDARGIFIKEIATGKYPKGTHSVKWNASDLPVGYYFYTLQTGSSIYSKKALIIR